MKKFIVLILGIVFLSACVALKPYDSNKVKMSMQKIMKTAKSISGSLKSGDLSTVSKDFITLEEQFTILSRMEAPKGTDEEWTMIHKEMVTLSIEGKKAAEIGDSKKVGSILGKLFELQKKGHGAFK